MTEPSISACLAGRASVPGMKAHVFQLHVGRLLSKIEEDGTPPRPIGRPGPEFFEALAEAEAAIADEDQRVHDVGARTPREWAELLTTPARGEQRVKAALRVGGKLLWWGVPAEPVLAHMLLWNVACAVPMLDGCEIEALWTYLLRRRAEKDA